MWLIRRAAVSAAAALIAATAVVALAVAFFFWATGSDRRLPVRETQVIIPPGSPAAETARLLEREGVISSAPAFDLLVGLRKLQGSVRAGQFRFGAHRTMDEVLSEV